MHYWQTLRASCKMSAPNGVLWNKVLAPVEPELPVKELAAA